MTGWVPPEWVALMKAAGEGEEDGSSDDLGSVLVGGIALHDMDHGVSAGHARRGEAAAETPMVVVDAHDSSSTSSSASASSSSSSSSGMSVSSCLNVSFSGVGGGGGTVRSRPQSRSGSRSRSGSGSGSGSRSRSRSGSRSRSRSRSRVSLSGSGSQSRSRSRSRSRSQSGSRQRAPRSVSTPSITLLVAQANAAGDASPLSSSLGNVKTIANRRKRVRRRKVDGGGDGPMIIPDVPEE